MSKANAYTGLVVVNLTAVMLSGQTESSIINFTGTSLKVVYIPASFAGTLLTFAVSYDRTTFYEYRNISNETVSIDVGAGNNAYGLAAQDFYGVNYLKLVSNLAQTEDVNINLVVRGL